MKADKAVVLSSGGVDSTTCLALAVRGYSSSDVASISVVYGQKHVKELECARQLAEYYNIPHYELDLTAVFAQSNCSLLSKSTESIPQKSYADQIKENGVGKVSTYVPFRNGLMLSAVASFAMSLFPNNTIDIYLGAHADDSAGDAYPDCSPEFTEAMNTAIYLGTYKQCSIVVPFVHMNKADVVRTGLSLDVPYELTWSCYEGGEKPCHKCGTCIDREAAFLANNTVDPLCKEDM